MTDLQVIKKAVDFAIYYKVIESQRDLANKLGYTESSLSQILNGKVPLSNRFISKLSLLDDRIRSILDAENIKIDKQAHAMSLGEKIKKMSNDKGITFYVLAKETGISESTLSRLLNNNTAKCKTSTVEKLAKYFNVKIEWLLSNVDTDKPFVIETEEDYEKAMKIGLKILPEISFEFAGGSTQLVNTTEYTKRFWYLPDSTDCEGIATISGNSMAPAYPSGCQVALKRIGFDPSFPLNIPFGQVFGVVVEDDITGMYHGHIKILRKHPERDQEKKYWVARSIDSQNYDDFYIDISNVRGLWIVKQHIVQDVIL